MLEYRRTNLLRLNIINYTDSEQSNVSENMKEKYKVFSEIDHEIEYWQALRVF